MKFFKPLIKGNGKYTKLNFLLIFIISFYVEEVTIFWHSIAEKYFFIWSSIEYRLIKIFDYLTKTSIINLKKFIVESINYMG